MKLLSISFATYNEEKNIGRLLNSIVNSHNFNQSIEIVVVDSQRTNDKTSKIVKSFSNARYIKFGNERSEQRNMAIKKSKGKYVFIPDADMELLPGLLTEIIALIKLNKNNNIGISIPERVPGENIYSKARNIEKQIYDNNEVISAARVYNRARLIEIGGFNEKLISGEDWDLSNRMKNAGTKIIFTKNHIKHHEESLGMWGAIRKKIFYAKVMVGYKIGINKQVNPIYRFLILFSRPKLIAKNPIVFLYLILQKSLEFGIGFFIYQASKKMSFNQL